MKVFVYGTLKPGERNYPDYCEGRVTSAIEAYTWGELYHLHRCGYPAMTMGDRRVRGFLLTFMDELALPALDELEGFNSHVSQEKNEYNRLKIPVFSLSDEWLTEAWGYCMSSERVQELGGVLVPSGWWEPSRIPVSVPEQFIIFS